MDKGLLIRELAERLGVSEDTLINWEVKGVRPNRALQKRLSSILGRDFIYLENPQI
jgi:DNA-binding transcriptional regulator YiaG